MFYKDSDYWFWRGFVLGGEWMICNSAVSWLKKKNSRGVCWFGTVVETDLGKWKSELIVEFLTELKWFQWCTQSNSRLVYEFKWYFFEFMSLYRELRNYRCFYIKKFGCLISDEYYKVPGYKLILVILKVSDRSQWNFMIQLHNLLKSQCNGSSDL